jgi:AcrR family transcriptional regulator
MVTKTRTQAKAVALSHNLVGQRLGRKGMETRERIIRAALCLLEGQQQDLPITLTAVAREASVGMTTLYLYFPNLGDLVLAALIRVMDSAGAAYLDRLRTRWPDARLAACCLDFLRAHLRFWRDHARVLHMRNSFADASDIRFLEYRNQASRPLLELLVRQMDGAAGDAVCGHFATVLLTGFERLATVVTNANWQITAHDFDVVDNDAYLDALLQAEAEVMALAIARKRRDARRCAQAGMDSAPPDPARIA